jgi:3-oxo-5-alpha-steroid 4-dehydrogenase 1
MIPAIAVAFNLLNGFLIGNWLSSPAAAVFLKDAVTSPRFWFGVFGWAFGLAGNIIHDEILMDLRRAKDQSDEDKPNKTPHYKIPYGYLYRYISYPNYFCEWFEWLCYAIAAAPFPNSTLATSPTWTKSPLALRFNKTVGDESAVSAPPAGITLVRLGARALGLSPPWSFFFSLVLTMLPRALSGHRWYHQKFPDYPKERTAVVPFII